MLSGIGLLCGSLANGSVIRACLAPCLATMLYGVNAFEISDNQEDEARPVPRQNHRRNNVTAAKLASAGVLANDNDNSTCSL